MSPKGWYGVENWSIYKQAASYLGKPYEWGPRQPVNADGTVTFQIYKEENDVFAHDVKIQLVEARDGAAAEVSTFSNGKRYTATGASKRNKGEPFVAGVGAQLALGRALENLGREMRKGIK